MARGRISRRVAVSFALLVGLLAIAPGLLVRAGAQYRGPATPGLTAPALRYQLLDTFGRIVFCDSDFFPVAAFGAEQTHASQAFPDIRSSPALFHAIVRHLHLENVTDFSDEQKLLVYREYKNLGAIQLSPLDGTYTFSLVASAGTTPGDSKLGVRIEGTIDTRGAITIVKKQPEYLRCPICLAGTSLVDTPRGRIAVRDLRVGMVVWTVDRSGRRHQAPIVRTSQTSVPVGHAMVDLALDDGRELIASPGHPTIDGRVIGNLSVGDRLDGGRIASAKRLPYPEAHTYDILPAGETGAYWANGILLASTLFDHQAMHPIR